MHWREFLFKDLDNKRIKSKQINKDNHKWDENVSDLVVDAAVYRIINSKNSFV